MPLNDDAGEYPKTLSACAALFDTLGPTSESLFQTHSVISHHLSVCYNERRCKVSKVNSFLPCQCTGKQIV